MHLLLLITYILSATAEDSKILVTDTPLSEEFSERVMTAPFAQISPQPVQITSPYFENLFYTKTSMQVRSSGSPTTSIRGSGQTGRVLYVLDNIPLNFLDGFGGSPLLVPTETLGHINIFEGPSSATYGNSAMGGSVHFIPRMVNSPLVRLGYSSPTDVNGAVLAPVINSENNQVQASAFLDTDQGNYKYEDVNGTRHKRDDNSQKLQRYTVIGRHKRDRWKFSEVLLYSQQDKRTPGPTNAPSVNQQNAKAVLAGFSSRYQLSDTSLWGARLSFSQLGSDNTSQDYGPSDSTSRRYWLNQTLAWQLTPSILSQTTFDFSHNEYISSYTSNDKFERNEPEVAQSFIFPLIDRLTIEPIVRYLGQYDETLLQVNLPYEWDNAKVWMMYAEGYRPPSLNDLYANMSYFVGNPNLKPETSHQWELGMDWHTDHVRLKSALFYTEYKNLLQSVPVSANVLTRANVGEARTYGSNNTLTVNYHPWNFELSYSQLHTKDATTGEPLKFSPESQFFSALSYTWQKWTFTVQETIWSNFTDTDFIAGQDVTMSGWDTTDILMNVKVNQKLNLNFGVYNLWDEARELSFGYPEPQRRFAGALEYSF